MNITTKPGNLGWPRGGFLLLALLSCLLLWGCDTSGTDGVPGQDGLPGDPGGPGDPGNPGEQPLYEAPGLHLEITAISGGTGALGNFLAGDTISVTFTVKDDEDNDLDLRTMNRGSIFVSGPSTNYQRVIASQSDVRANSVDNGDGTWTYTFAAPIPATYLAPLNDTTSFGSADGELTGQALLNGTYTVGMQVRKDYTFEEGDVEEADVATADFLYGAAGAIERRDVVTNANCNACHQELRAHGDNYKDVSLCVLCHTAGAEDRNVPAAAGGTPGTTIDFRVMIHKIHNAAHLPSVLGVATFANGSRNYGATPKPLQYVGYNDTVIDFSDVGFPVMPSAYVAYLFDQAGTTYTGTGGNGPMPRDLGYSALPPPQKLQDDKIRTGVVACDKCHGDPDGTGPLPAPAQGDNYRTRPTRAACASCHDDIDWSSVYAANTQTMPSNLSNSTCTSCHPASGDPLSVGDAHLHPYSNPVLNTGVNIDITGVGGGTGPGGNHMAGDPLTVTFGVRNDGGADLNLNTLARFQWIVHGPSENPSLLTPNLTVFDNAFRKSSAFTGNGTISAPSVGAGAVAQVLGVVFTGANVFNVVGSVSGTVLVGVVVPDGGGNTGAVTAAGVTFTITDGSTNFAAGDRWYLEVWPTAPSYTINVPMDVTMERVGLASGGAQTMNVANTPLWWGRQTIFERTAIFAGTALTGDAKYFGRYVEVDIAAVPGIAVGDRVVIEDGVAAKEEYLAVGHIQTTDDVTGADLGTRDRVWFTTSLRYDHAAGAAVQEVTLTSKREGIHYNVTNTATGEITLLAGQFGTNPVVASYRANLKFGRFRAPGDTRQDVYVDAPADTEDIEQSWGDWKGLPFLDGTYTIGMWVNRDFSIAAYGETTTYRMISPPAGISFLYGDATTITPRHVIEDGESCNKCHGDLQAHGNGRRGFETCIHCHTVTGLEDGPKYTFSAWYVGPTPGATMDFRTLLHKVHMGEELSKGSSYVVNGVFLGVPYPVKYDEVVFPVPGGAASCVTCHGNDTWLAPADRTHPAATALTRTWRGACGSCHDSDAAAAHFDVQTPGGIESCDICHGEGRSDAVEKVHETR